MNLEDLKTHVDARFDRLENKVDTFAERQARSEEAIKWLKTHLKTMTAIVLAVGGWISNKYFNMFGG